jgi:hypothetical protein
MNNALNTVLGFDTLNPPKDSPYSRDEFIHLWEQGVMGTGLRLMFGSLSFILPSKSFERSCASIRKFVNFYIDRERDKADRMGPKNFVEAFLEHTDDQEFIRNHLVQGIIGAQDTTSILMSNTVHFLARRPELWRELREEVLSKGDSLFSFDNLRHNTLIQNIFSECTYRTSVRPAFLTDHQLCACAPSFLPSNAVHSARPSFRRAEVQMAHLPSTAPLARTSIAHSTLCIATNASLAQMSITLIRTAGSPSSRPSTSTSPSGWARGTAWDAKRA